MREIISNADLQRFLSKINIGPEDECWEWTGPKKESGYGLFWWRGGNRSAHRTSYRIHRGEIPAEKYICHHCDNPSCVNPKHLFVGSHKDNMFDMAKKGRAMRSSMRRGKPGLQARHDGATIMLARFLVAHGATQGDTGRWLNCSQSSVGMWARGEMRPDVAMVRKKTDIEIEREARMILEWERDREAY
jgi:hypothetical protein